MNPAKPQAADSPAKSGGDGVVGDDIGIGLAGSIRLGDPSSGNSFWEGWRKDIAKRDERVRQLKEFLATRPASSVPIECFVGDTLYEAHGCSFYQSNILLYCSGSASESDASYMASLGFVRVAERDWLRMRPWMSKSAARTTPWLPRVSDLREVAVFSYYDGNHWRIAPWFYLSYVPEMREPTETDLAIFSLIEYVNSELQPPQKFAIRYLGNILLLDKEEVEKNLKQGRPWDYSDRKKAPEAKPEEKPDAKSPAVAPK